MRHLIAILIAALAAMAQGQGAWRGEGPAAGVPYVEKDTAAVFSIIAVDTVPPPADTVAPPPRRRADLSDEEYYRLAFGVAPERPRVFAARVFADGFRFGETAVQYNEDFLSFDFESRLLARYLDTVLLDDAREVLGEDALAHGNFNSARLSELGYELTVDDDDFTLTVAIPSEAKRLQRRNLRRSASPPRGDEVPAAKVSFYVDARAETDIRYQSYSYTDPSHRRWREDYDTLFRNPAKYDFDGAIRAFDWVLEGGARINEPREPRPLVWNDYRRNNVYLTRDFVPQLSRLTIGDVRMSGNVLGGDVIGGARYERSEQFFNHDPRDGADAVTFFMPRPGEVDLYLDGQYVRRFRLPAGYHELSGFGGRVGRNSVRLETRFDDGTVEEMPFTFILGDPRNMVKGTYRYTAAFGMRRYTAPAPECYLYSFRELGGTADFVYGLGHMVTTGLGAQASPYNAVFGAQVLWSFDSLGAVNLRVSGNRADSSGGGIRADMDYSIDPHSALVKMFGESAANLPFRHLRLSVNAYMQSEKFSSNVFAPYAHGNQAAGGFGGSAGFSMPKWSVSADGTVTFNRDLGWAGYAYSPLSYRYGLRGTVMPPRGSVSVGVGSSAYNGVHSPYASLSGGISFGVKRHRLSASSGVHMRTRNIPAHREAIEYLDSVLQDPDFDGPAYKEIDAHDEYYFVTGTNVGWNWSNGRGGNSVGAQSYRANLQFTDLDPRWNASANHTYNRGQLRLNYNYNDNEYTYYDMADHTVKARFGASFMFADGLWAVGRPTNGNFVLIAPRQNLKGAKVHVGRARNREFSSSGWLGSAYQNRIGQYRSAQFDLRLTDAPAGAWLEQSRYHVMGKYKQGYVLRLGQEAQVFVIARLTDEGKPLANAYVVIEPVSGGGLWGERRDTFTGGDGVLQMGDLVPGESYRLKFASSTYIKEMIINIPPNAREFYETGDIEVEKE